MLAAALGGAVALGLRMGGAARADDVSDLIGVTRAGGHVVYLRHADTTGEPRDRTMDLTHRALQRNLSYVGRGQARAIGRAIGRLRLPVGLVATSPVFRALDTAELAFGPERVTVDPWLTADDYIAGSYAAHVAALRKRLATPPTTGVTWLIGQGVTLSMAVGAAINRDTFGEGAAAVFRPETTGFTLLGILPRGWETME